MGNSDDLDAGVPARGPGTIAFYVNRSFAKAFGQFSNRPGVPDANADPRAFCVNQFTDWEPLRGFAVNKERILALYNYYRDMYVEGKKTFQSDKLLWAGLGRMAGGAVVGGLNLLAKFGFDVSPLTQDQVNGLSESDEIQRRSRPVVGFLEIGKMIFLDLAWQHEAFLDEPRIALDLARKYDAQPRITAHYPDLNFRPLEQAIITAHRENSYEDAWVKIISADPAKIGLGNQLLLQNEQFNLVQPVYDKMLVDMTLQFHQILSDPSPFTGNIHPYHRDFIEAKPGKVVLQRDDRWAWITEPGGMLDKWAFQHPNLVMTTATREGLVTTSMSDSVAHQWPIAQPELVVGAP